MVGVEIGREAKQSEEQSHQKGAMSGVSDAAFVDKQERACFSDFLKERPAIKYRTPTEFGSGTWVFWDDPMSLPCDPGGIPTTTNPVTTNKVLYALLSSSLRMLGSPDKPFMVQFWSPITIGGRRLLATSDQPFGLSHLRQGLFSYRKECVGLKLCVEAEVEVEVGVLGGVFRNKCFASTPNVAYYSVTEYPQRQLALKCNVMAHWAVPLFESSTQNCAGVLEFLTYGDGGNLIIACLNEIRRNLQEFDLKVGVPDGCKQGWAAKHSKIRELMRVVPQLDFGIAWVACRDCNTSVEHHPTALEKSCSGFDQICLVELLVPPSDRDKYLLYDFGDYCREFHLQKGQGLVGKAYLSRKPYFCRDITKFTSNEYPLVHHARHAGLAQSFAICLHDSDSDSDYILELFFEPGDCEDPQVFLGSFMIKLQKFPNFKVASGEESREELCVEVVRFGMQRCQTIDSAPWPGTSNDGDGDGGDNSLVSSNQQAVVEVEDHASRGTDAVVVDVEESDPTTSYSQGTGAEISISRETIMQHFGRKTLGDTAEILGVHPSTLKRRLKQYEIGRWPRCKRERTNHSPSDQHSPIPHPLPKQPVATVNTTLQNASTIKVKAKYRKDYLQFEFPFSSGLVELKEQLSHRLELRGARYKISYSDEKGDSILLACKKDLKDYMESCRPLGVATIKISVLPMNNK